MHERPPQPPEGRLIAEALKRSGLSGRQAAARVPMSEGRWRQIVHGYEIARRGVYIQVTASAERLAQMAQVVGLTPEQLTEAGREDAADELRELRELAERQTDDEPTLAEMSERVRRLTERMAELTEQTAALERQAKEDRAERARLAEELDKERRRRNAG